MQNEPAFNYVVNGRTTCSTVTRWIPQRDTSSHIVSHHQTILGLETQFQDTNVINYVTGIRPEEKSVIKRSVLPGKIIQICGPPMVGKTVLLDQVVSEIQTKASCNTRLYRINCKNVTNLEEVCKLILNELQQTKPCASSKSNTLRTIESVLAKSKDQHHVFIFYKCEGLRLFGTYREFLYFVNQIVNFYWSEKIEVTVMFTTYVLFPYNGHKIELINIGMLNDPIDVLSLLEHFVPDTDGTDYIDVCQTILAFPEGIIGFAQKFLRNGFTTPSCPIEDWISSDINFLSSIFSKRLHEVETWLNAEDLHFIRQCRPTMSRTFTEDSLKEEYQLFNPRHGYNHWCACLKRLCDSHVIQYIPGKKALNFHPLVVYHCMISQVHDDLTYLAAPLSWNTQFLCKVLIKAEEALSHTGRRFVYYDHWSEVRPLMEKAINSPNDGSFSAIYQIGIIASRFIMSSCPNEAKQFYDSLFRMAQVLGSRGQTAAIEAYCGHLSASGADVNWTLAEKRLDSAISVLKHEGPVYFYRWATRRKAIILHRQGKYQASLRTYEDSMAILNPTVGMFPEDKRFNVFGFQEDEEFFTGAIYQTIPLIFTGKTDEALVKLRALLDDVESRTEYHPDYPVLLNNIGLALERGDRNLKEALRWYEKSLQERRHMSKLTPQLLVVSLNNIGMLLNEQEDSASQSRSEFYLQEALNIQSKSNWFHNSTALTLIHLSEVKLKKQNYTEAFEFAAEADVILMERNKDWSYRLKVLLQLAHCRLMFDLHGLQSGQPNTKLLKSHKECKDQNLSDNFLKKSAEYYIQEILSVAKCRGGEGFDFHHRYLSACAHGMLLHVGLSEVNYQNYRCLFVQHVENFDLLGKFSSRREQSKFQQNIYSALFGFYQHIQNSMFDFLNVTALTDLMNSFCRFCHILHKNDSKYKWVNAMQ